MPVEQPTKFGLVINLRTARSGARVISFRSLLTQGYVVPDSFAHGSSEQVWEIAEEIGYPFGPAIQLLILTAQRRGEVGR
jgi:hypothetical protein